MEENINTQQYKSCTFCGHHNSGFGIYAPLYNTIKTLINDMGVDCFYVGNHGCFDSMALYALKELQREYLHIKYYVVLAYMPTNTDLQCCKSDIPTIYPEGLELIPKRFAISYRNRWMVEKSDYLISHVTCDIGGAAKTLNYAKRKQITIINISS